MSSTIYTVGHSTQPVSDFLDLIKKHGIDCIVDVRSTPYSQYAPQFNESEIKYALKQERITYIYMGKEFGARQVDKSLYDKDGKLDFAKTARSKMFKFGLERIKQGVEMGYTIALMCTEKNPMECHRCILVGREINRLDNLIVENIMADGSLLSQNKVEEKLLESYCADRNQISMIEFLSGEQKSDEEYLDEAYAKRAKEIAYQI